MLQNISVALATQKVQCVSLRTTSVSPPCSTCRSCLQGFCNTRLTDSDVDLLPNQCRLLVAFRLLIWPGEGEHASIWLDNLLIKLVPNLKATESSQNLVRWGANKTSKLWATRLTLVNGSPSLWESSTRFYMAGAFSLPTVACLVRAISIFCSYCDAQGHCPRLICCSIHVCSADTYSHNEARCDIVCHCIMTVALMFATCASHVTL